MKKRLIASLVMSISLGGLGIANNASAKTLDKDGLLKTNKGKVVMGYHVFEEKLYKDGRLSKGYAVIGKGAKAKLYYNGSLKKGYKTAQKKTLLFKDGVLVKGYKQAGKNERLYKNGRLATGYCVHKAADGTTYLYQNGVLKKGYKKATRNDEVTLFLDGRVAQGFAEFQKRLYENGKLNSGMKEYKNILYKDSEPFTGIYSYLKYNNGELTTNDAQAITLSKLLEQVDVTYNKYNQSLGTISSYYTFNQLLNEKYKPYLLQAKLDDVKIPRVASDDYYGALNKFQKLLEDNFTQQEFNVALIDYVSHLEALIQQELSLFSQLTTEGATLVKSAASSKNTLSLESLAMVYKTTQSLEEAKNEYLNHIQVAILNDSVNLPQYTFEPKKKGAKALTHFLAEVNPINGNSSMIVVAGKVPSDPNNNSVTGSYVYPSGVLMTTNQDTTNSGNKLIPENQLSNIMSHLSSPMLTNLNMSESGNQAVLQNFGITFLNKQQALLPALSEKIQIPISINEVKTHAFIDAIPSLFYVDSEEKAIEKIEMALKSNILFNGVNISVVKQKDGEYKVFVFQRTPILFVFEKTVVVQVDKKMEALEEIVNALPTAFPDSNPQKIEDSLKKMLQGKQVEVNITEILDNRFAYQGRYSLDGKVTYRTLSIPPKVPLAFIASVMSQNMHVDVENKESLISKIKEELTNRLKPFSGDSSVEYEIIQQDEHQYKMIVSRGEEKEERLLSVTYSIGSNDGSSIVIGENSFTVPIPKLTPEQMEKLSRLMRAEAIKDALNNIPHKVVLKNKDGKEQQLREILQPYLRDLAFSINEINENSFRISIIDNLQIHRRDVGVEYNLALGILEEASTKISGRYEVLENTDANLIVKDMIEREIQNEKIAISVNGQFVTISLDGEQIQKEINITVKPDADKVALEAARAKVSGSYELEEGADEAAGVKKLVEAEISDASIRVSVAGKKVTLSKNGKEVTKGYEVIFKPDADKVALEAALSKVKGSYSFAYDTSSLTAAVKNAIEQAISDATISISVASDYTVTLTRNGKSVSKSVSVTREDKPYVPETVTAATVQQAASQLQLPAEMVLPTDAYTQAQQRALLLAEAKKKLGSNYSVAIKSFKFVQPVSALSKVKAKAVESEGPQYLTVAVTFDVSRSGYTATTSELQTKFLVTAEMKEAAFAAIQQAMKQPQTDFTKIHPGLQMMLDVGGIFELDLDGYAELQYPTYIGEFRLNDFIGAGIEGFTSRFNEFAVTQKSNEDALVEGVQSIVDGTSSYSLYEVYGWFANNFSYSLMDENADEPFALSNEEVSALIMKKIGQKDITIPVLIEAYLAAQPGAEEASAFIKEKEAAFETITDKSQLIDFYKQIDELSLDAKWLLKDEALNLRYDQTLANSWVQIWLHEFFLNDLNDVEYEEALLDLADENGGTKLPGQYPEHINKDIYVPLLRDAVAALTSDERKMLTVELQRTGYGSIEDYLALFADI